MRSFVHRALIAGALVSCSPAAIAPPGPTASASSAAAPARKTTLLTIVGTSDLHGHIETTPLLGGYVKNLRKARASDGGVLLVDAGDLFQGTLESNLGEGVAVLHAYGALGYAASAIGNHEFDYGPVGPLAMADKPGIDPRGALAARAKESPFPMLAANVLLKATHERLPIGVPSVVAEVGGLRVGIVGVTSADTLKTTLSANVSDLEIAPLAETLEREARRLRADEHADVVVALTHAGSKCKTFTGDLTEDECEPDGEVFHVARKLAPGTIDAIVAGHTHQGVAVTVAGIPIVESFSYGRAFGRIDLTVEKEGGRARVVSTKIFPPRELCPDRKANPADCDPGDYEGAHVERDVAVTAAIAADVENARARRSEFLGVVLEDSIKRDYDHESEEGNLFADLLRRSHPKTTVAMVNGGGLRNDLPAGPLTYGSLYEAFPFDNRITTAKITGADLTKMLRAHFEAKGGILSVSGIRVRASCDKGDLRVDVEYDTGKPVRPDDEIVLLASDFMMTGGDGFWGPIKPPDFAFEDTVMRDALESELRKQKKIKPSDLVDHTRPRMVFPKARPVRCEK